MTEQQKQSQWYLKPEDKNNYMKMFTKFDTNSSGTLSSAEMQQVMVMTKLDQQICAKVWELSNPQYANDFTKPMFFIAMHLMYKKRLNPDTEIP